MLNVAIPMVFALILGDFVGIWTQNVVDHFGETVIFSNFPTFVYTYVLVHFGVTLLFSKELSYFCVHRRDA